MRHLHNVLIFDTSINRKLHLLIDRHYSVGDVVTVSDLYEASSVLGKKTFALILIAENKITEDVSDVLSLIERKHYNAVTMLLMDGCEPVDLVHAAKTGVTGFTLIDERPITIFQGVQQMFINGSYIHPEIAPVLLKGMTNVPALQEVSANLTKREIDILVHIAKGCSCNQISEQLNISNHTVSSHIKNIYRKLDIHSKGEAVMEAVRMGLVNVDGANVG